MRIVHKLLPVACALAIGVLACTTAQADTGIGLLRTFGSGQVSFPYGVAVDQETGEVYVGSSFGEGGGVGKFDSTQSFLFQFKFGPSGSPRASGVAVDPVNHDLYAVAAGPVERVGGQEIQTYDPSSTASSSSPLSHFSVSGSGRGSFDATEEQIAADSKGNIYFPNAPHNEVQVFSPSGGAPGGGIAATITGSGGDALKEPGGVAVNSETSGSDIYVADTGNGRVEEFEPSGAFLMAIGTGVNQTEHERVGLEPGETTQEKEAKENVCTAASGDTCGPGSDDTQAVAVDSKTGNIYALDVAGSSYHVVEYDSAGAKLADFGSGEIGASFFLANTLAVDSTTGDVYVTSDKEEGENFGDVDR